MRIFALNFSCERDEALSNLMEETLIKYGMPHVVNIKKIVTGGLYYNTWGNGAGWPASMMKLSAIDQYLNEFEMYDRDFILSVDSDVVFTGEELFNVVNENKHDYSIMGTQHKPPYETKYGPFGHMSGSLIFMRVDIVRMMVALSDHELKRIRFEEFKPFTITENEDVVLSYLAMACGARALDLPGTLSSGNFEEEIKTGDLKSYYHLNYNPITFLGQPITGKWDIPNVLKDKNIEL